MFSSFQYFKCWILANKVICSSWNQLEKVEVLVYWSIILNTLIILFKYIWKNIPQPRLQRLSRVGRVPWCSNKYSWPLPPFSLFPDKIPDLHLQQHVNLLSQALFQSSSFKQTRIASRLGTSKGTIFRLSTPVRRWFLTLQIYRKISNPSN